MAGETGKQRRSRIELTYYRRPDALALRRRALAASAVLGATAWLVLAPTWDSNRAPATRLFQWSRLASPGPLAHPHAAWTDRCDVCHPAFAPINNSRWSPLPASDPHASEASCTTCHSAADHYPVRGTAAVPSCAECHRDHRGPDARLARPRDNTCTRCHADLATHRVGDATFAERVTSFDADHHPAFKPLQAADPGHLKFNHALHLAPGITLEDGGRPFTVDRLPENQRARYNTFGSSPQAPLKLECADCHQPDATGAYMKPITYLQHCSACHSLGFDPAMPNRQVTHGRPPAELVSELRGLYARAAVDADDSLLARRVPDRPLPGRPGDATSRSAGEAIDAKLITALRKLLGAAPNPGAKQSGCLECHEATAPEAPFHHPDDYAAIQILPTNVPAVWFTHARFDHAAHRASACLDCHTSAAFAYSTSSRDILLPDLTNCITCHAPAHITDSGPRGGVDYSCTECHRYHHGAPSSPVLAAPPSE